MADVKYKVEATVSFVLRMDSEEKVPRASKLRSGIKDALFCVGDWEYWRTFSPQVDVKSIKLVTKTGRKK